MAAKKGKCPSLISGTRATPVFEEAKGKRKCNKCSGEILKGTPCVVVPNPRTGATPSFCYCCFREIISKTMEDLNSFSKIVDL